MIIKPNKLKKEHKNIGFTSKADKNASQRRILPINAILMQTTFNYY